MRAFHCGERPTVSSRPSPSEPALPPSATWPQAEAAPKTVIKIAKGSHRLEFIAAPPRGLPPAKPGPGPGYRLSKVRRRTGDGRQHEDIRGRVAMQIGTSGGVWGLERGYCLMIGGEREVVERLDPIWRTLAPGRGDVPPAPGREGKQSTAEEGYLHCGPVGAGHFVKMIHNGIEYGLMQAYAEGFDIFRNATSESLPEGHRYDLDLADIAELWRRGSVVSSWLLDLTASALAENPELSEYTGAVQDSGEGRWTVMAAIEEAVPVHVLASSLFDRFRSRQENTFGEKVLSAMRFKFGGHVELRPKAGKKEGS